jgi:hypothetical protein
VVLVALALIAVLGGPRLVRSVRSRLSFPAQIAVMLVVAAAVVLEVVSTVVYFDDPELALLEGGFSSTWQLLLESSTQ